VNAAIIEFNALADTVGASTQNHDLTVFGGGCGVRRVICGKVIGRIFNAADGHRFPAFGNAQAQALSPDVLFRNVGQLSDILVRKPVDFGALKDIVRQSLAFVSQDLFIHLHQVLHLLNEPGFDMRLLKQSLDRGAFSNGFIHYKLSFTGCVS